MRSGTAMLRVTGPVTSSMSACRGEATKCSPKRSMSYTGPERPTISISQPLHEPASTCRIASARPNSDLARESISCVSVTAPAPSRDSGSVTMPVRWILRNSFMSAVLLPPKGAQHRLAFGEAVTEELASDAQQLPDETTPKRIVRQRPFLARHDQVPRAERGQVLGDGGLIQLERILKLLHGPFGRRKQLEDADARRMAERAKQIGLEGLQLRRRHYINIFEYIEDCVNQPNR